MKAVKINITGIDEAIKDLDIYKDSLKLRTELFMQKLAEYGAECARAEIVTMDAVFTGKLVNSIFAQRMESDTDSVIFAVRADSEHAIFVEMGTGIVGATTPYPGKLPTLYAQGKTIHQTLDGKYGWYYKNANGDWFFTEGMVSRPFMYDASTQMRHEIERIAREVFK